MLGKYEESTEIREEYLQSPTNLSENKINYMIGVNYASLHNEKEAWIYCR